LNIEDEDDNEDEHENDSDIDEIFKSRMKRGRASRSPESKKMRSRKKITMRSRKKISMKKQILEIDSVDNLYNSSKKDDTMDNPEGVPIKHKKEFKNTIHRRQKLLDETKTPFSEDSSDAFQKAFKVEKGSKRTLIQKFTKKNEIQKTKEEEKKDDVMVIEVVQVDNSDLFLSHVSGNDEPSDVVIS
jgi:hypothetical protein